jgi:hypothetical protein
MCNCDSPKTVRDTGGLAGPVVMPTVPVAGPIGTVGLTPDPEGPIPPTPFPQPPGGGIPFEFPRFPRHEFELPVFKFCTNKFPDGCWQITLSPTNARSLVGTLRVDRAAPNAGSDSLIVSGDLYRQPRVVRPIGPLAEVITATASSAALSALRAERLELFRAPRIPIYARANYHSYLKGIRLSVPTFSRGSCSVTLDVEQFDYTHPPAGQFQGSFPASANRTVRIVVDRGADNFWGRPTYSGQYSEGGVVKGTVSLEWVSTHLRRAVLEIDTLVGAVAPQPVPNPSGTGNDYFDTLYAKAGWQLTVVQDQTNIAVPAGVNANACWSSANLHALMQAVRKPTTNLDTEWRTHLIVVPATMGCSRGVMYDQIAVPREGSASFCNDGYPVSNSANFGTAANQQQRNVPRAYLRSACHEVTHAFNQIHQEQETAPDNSIMTTTPSVADVLGGPASGAPGVFPDQINIDFNATVRNHLAHMPDPVVRPGGWPFGAWFGNLLQAGDYAEFDPSELSLSVVIEPNRPALGEPVMVTWTLTNNTDTDLTVPTDISLEGTLASIEVVDSRGNTSPVRAFEILCDDGSFAPLAPGASLQSQYRVFWSTAGFAFERPGRYELTVGVSWSANGVPVSVRGTTEVNVDTPLTDADNAAAALSMHPEVGMWVALDGGADHLPEAVARVAALTQGVAPAGGRALDAVSDAGAAASSQVGRAFAAIAGGNGAGPQDTGDGGSAPVRRAAKKTAAKKTVAKKTAAKKTAAKKTAAKKSAAGQR